MTVTVLLGLALHAHAQGPFRDGVGLGEVVRTALANSPAIETARLAVEAEAGALVLAGGPFDPFVRAGLARSHDGLPPIGGRTTFPVTGSLEATTSFVKPFRSGVVVSSDLAVGRVQGGSSGLSADMVQTSVSVLAPLAGGRGGGAEAGAERAAGESHAASRLEREHVEARSVHDAAYAYWRYLAAYEQLDTYRESVERARRLVEETEALVQADERPASDRDVMASNLAGKRTAAVAADQTLLDARHALVITMGLGSGAIPGIGRPVTAFPSDDGHQGSPVAASAGAELVRLALSGRRDLAGLRTRRDGARLAAEGAFRDAGSRWDLLASVGYAAIWPRLGDGSAVVARFGGMSSRVQIRYEPLFGNDAARGLARRTAALEQSAVVAVDDLTRTIAANVRVAVAGLGNAIEEARVAREAVRLSERSVRTEQEKFRLGLATLFDAILAEDALTDALLRRTNAQFRLAVALLRLRFETATLTGGGGVAVNRLTSFDFEEFRQ